VRFFQLAVFATMFVRDHHRPAFHQALGLEPAAYGMQVFRITIEICKQVFPDLLDVDNPAFLAGLERLNTLAKEIEVASASGVLGKVKALWLRGKVVATMARLYFLPTLRNTLPAETRLEPAW
jgi:magnesium-protoporphyrin IX monomethyl ester (oxidative) cyclase